MKLSGLEVGDILVSYPNAEDVPFVGNRPRFRRCISIDAKSHTARLGDDFVANLESGVCNETTPFATEWGFPTEDDIAYMERMLAAQHEKVRMMEEGLVQANKQRRRATAERATE